MWKLYANKANLRPQFIENLPRGAYSNFESFLSSVYTFGMVIYFTL